MHEQLLLLFIIYLKKKGQTMSHCIVVFLFLCSNFIIHSTVSLLVPPILVENNKGNLHPTTTIGLLVAIDGTITTGDASTYLSNEDENFVQHIDTDRRPHEQRTKGPRTARRLNHPFRHLYRSTSNYYHNVTAFEYLTQFYSETRVLDMNRTFPPLLELNVSRHIYPKIRFLQETIILDNSKSLSKFDIPPQYFGARLEKTIAPRHAFLVYQNLTHGASLLRREDADSNLPFRDFLVSCRKTKRFCALCNKWRKEQGEGNHVTSDIEQITSKQIEAFDFIFNRGLMAATRNEMVQEDNNWPLKHINITSTEIIKLLVQHGANPLERDVRGTTLLHWAAGTGNLETFKVLLPFFPNGFLEKTERDRSSVLHWASAGANGREFGTGGHCHLCQYILSQCDDTTAVSAKDIVNQLTKDGNSPLMWAAWSKSLDTVKLMVRYRAKWDIFNRNGCTVAHWAASGGSLEVCLYLADVVGVNFFVPNHAGNTPLMHAIAFCRLDVVSWLRKRAALLEGENSDDIIAKQLAVDFANWNEEQPGDDQRREQVLELFQDDYWGIN